MTGEERNRIAVRAMAVASFNAPVRRGETCECAMDEIVAVMEGRWPVTPVVTPDGDKEHDDLASHSGLH